MRSSAFVFGLDLLGEGCGAVLGNLQDRAGLDDVTFSATYHDARDVFPHNPRYHVHRHEGDIAWFAPERRRYKNGLRPQPAAAAAGADLLAEVCEQADRRGMRVDAWTIFLHNSALATVHPDCATRNVYGDPYLSDLCPANPRVQAYCVELAGDLARYPVRRLLAESLHYRPLEHGEHHERYLMELPGGVRTLLSVCFCTHCQAAGRAAGVKVEALARAVRDTLQPIWEGAPAAQVAAACASPQLCADLDAFVQVRMATVTALVAQVRGALAHAGVRLGFIDHSGAMSHVMLGIGADDEVTLSARKLGIDLAAVAAASDEVFALGYVDSAERLQALLASYVAAIPPGHPLAVALRPLLPDCRDSANLAAKVAAVRAAGADSVAFYHYAMMPLNRLDWIRQALHGEGGTP
jgi:hypothetical protein